jgi:hypothetical protein
MLMKNCYWPGHFFSKEIKKPLIAERPWEFECASSYTSSPSPLNGQHMHMQYPAALQLADAENLP